VHVKKACELKTGNDLDVFWLEVSEALADKAIAKLFGFFNLSELSIHMDHSPVCNGVGFAGIVSAGFHVAEHSLSLI